jgi:hypothetical protein
MAAEQLKVNMIIDGVNYPIGMAVTPEFRNSLPNHLRVRTNFEPAHVEPEPPAVEEFPPPEEEEVGP